MKGLKKISTIFISVLICILSAAVFAGCDNDSKTCKLYVFSAQGGYVLVDDSKDPVEFGDEGSKTFVYNRGDTVKLKAVAERGYDFVKWECTDKIDQSINLTNEEIEFKINDAKVVVRAKFVLDGTVKYTVSWEQSDAFQIAPQQGYTTEVDLRGEFKFKINPSIGYDLSGVEVKANGVKLTPVLGVYTINNIAEDIKITVGGVTKEEFEVAVETRLPQGIIVSPVDNYTWYVEYGDDFKFEVNISNDSYSIDGIKVYSNGSLLSAVNGVYTISNITSNINITLDIKKHEYNITCSQSEGFELNLEDDYGEYPYEVSHGGEFKFKVELLAGYVANNLQVLAKINNNSTEIFADGKGIYTIENITDDVQIIINGISKENYEITYISRHYDIVPQSGYDFTVEYGDDFRFTVKVHEGFTYTNLNVYCNDMLITSIGGGVYKIENITSEIEISVEGIVAATPQAQTYEFTLAFTDDIVNQSGDIYFFMPEKLKFTFIEGTGVQSYNVNSYPTAFECDSEKYSASEFEELINSVLDDLWLGDYVVECLAADANLEVRFIIFEGDKFTVDWNLIPSVGTIYVGLKNVGGDTNSSYGITYTQGNYNIVPQSGYDFTVEHGGSFRFTIQIHNGYTATNMKVYKDNVLITSIGGGVYEIKNITSNVNIRVDGISKAHYDVIYVSRHYDIVPQSGYDFVVEHGGTFRFTVRIHNGFTANNMRVYKDDVLITSIGGGVYEIKNITSEIEISVEGIVEESQTPETPEATTFTFSILLPDYITDGSLNGNPDAEIYLPDILTFTFVEGEGEQEYDSAEYPLVFNCYDEYYSAEEFEQMINDILSNDLFLSYELAGFAATETLDIIFMVFNGDTFTIDWDWMPKTGNIYMIFNKII